MLSNKLNPVHAVSLGVMSLISMGIDAQQRSNIVVIVADDLASHEIGCYGGKNVPTPNIDRIAREGIRFTNCYASTSMSVPIRASLYTGLYPVRNGTYKNHQTSRSDIKSIAAYFPENGYQVWRTGKTHTSPRSVFQFEDIPGFEQNCVRETADYYTDSLELRIRDTKDPFCLFVCSTNPHAPWTVGDPSFFDPDKLILPPLLPDSKDFRDIYCKYLAEVKELDNQVGAVWRMLEKTGQLDNTLLMFLGEQGPQFPGGKWTCWNYGVSSAMVARYPDKIKAGNISDALVQYEDILPTLIDFADGKPVDGIDGKSFLPALFGKNGECRQWAYGNHNNVPEGSAYPIRSIRDKRYKLIVNLTPEVPYFEKHLMNSKVWTCWSYGDEHAKAMAERYVRRPALEFYDTKIDPWELNNLASDKKYAKKIAEMKQLLEQWMKEQGDSGAALDVPQYPPKKQKEIRDKLTAIQAYDRAVHIKDGWIRDPYIVTGRDGYYYLTGTTPNPGDPREMQDKYNLGLTPQSVAIGKQPSIVGHKIRIWRSPDLADWEPFGVQFSLEEGYWAQKHPEAFDKDSGKEWLVWAPEMYYSEGKWLFVHTSPSPYRNGANLIVSNGLVHSELNFPMGDDMLNKHDPSLFLDDDGTWYLTWANTFIAPIKPGFAGLADKPRRIDPSDRIIGHEGATIRKIGKKYVLFGTAWSTDQGRKGSYNLYYCTADNIYGPYSERRYAGRFLGHGTPFQDKEGRWWCTAFYNANVAPLPGEGIQQKDLSETAQTINEQGTTIVPLDVRILENGDVYVRAIDDRYATIGPDEKDKDKLK
jgi:arylsulfatase A-like enzyme